MNRRGFLGRILGAAAAVKFAPKLLAKDTPGEVIPIPISEAQLPAGKGVFMCSGYVSQDQYLELPNGERHYIRPEFPR